MIWSQPGPLGNSHSIQPKRESWWGSDGHRASCSLKPLPRAETPAPLGCCPAKGNAPGPELWGLEIPAKVSWGALSQGPATPGGARPLSSSLPPFSSHLGAEKKEEKVRKRQLSPRLLRSRSGRTETAEGVQMGFFLLINPNFF